jgi:hypothetical protein
MNDYCDVFALLLVCGGAAQKSAPGRRTDTPIMVTLFTAFPFGYVGWTVNTNF